MPVQWQILSFDEVGSTSDIVREKALEGVGEGLVILAKRQARGRGRQGRGWHSPVGNLYFSALLRPQGHRSALSSLALVIGLALVQAMENNLRLAVPAKLKWPNDVLVGDAKLAGVLLEGDQDRQGSAFVIVGCGVNILHNPAIADYPTTSLSEQGAACAPETLLHAFLERFQEHYCDWLTWGFAKLREVWLARAWRYQEPLLVRLGEERVQGLFHDVDADGALILDCNGDRRRFVAGELPSVPLADQPHPIQT